MFPPPPVHMVLPAAFASLGELILSFTLSSQHLITHCSDRACVRCSAVPGHGCPPTNTANCVHTQPEATNKVLISWLSISVYPLSISNHLNRTTSNFEWRNSVLPGHRYCAENESTPALKEGFEPWGFSSPHPILTTRTCRVRAVKFSSPAQSWGRLRAASESWDSAHPRSLCPKRVLLLTWISREIACGGNYSERYVALSVIARQINWDSLERGYTVLGEWHTWYFVICTVANCRIQVNVDVRFFQPWVEVQRPVNELSDSGFDYHL